jgi:dTDP-glucose pyrophosphorylase
MNNYFDNTVKAGVSAKEALAKLDEVIGSKTLFVLDGDKKLIGTLTDGDIRRGLLKGTDIEANVEEFISTDFRYLQKNNYSVAQLEKLRKDEIKLVPLLDENKCLINVIDFSFYKSFLPIDAIIMAGGKGERLKPLTDTIPKPLLKVGDKPIIEHNIDRLVAFGIQNIHVSVKYLAEKIVDYLGDGSEKGISIQYIYENEALGTIGAAGLIENFEQDKILIMNSDLLTDIDYEDFFQMFEETNADMAIATIPYNVNVPYAVLEVDGNIIKSFKEKPIYTYYSNAGIYLLKKSILDLIPKHEFFNATDLMELLISKQYKVVSYPVRSYWLDIGKHDDFNKAQNDIDHIRL